MHYIDSVQTGSYAWKLLHRWVILPLYPAIVSSLW
jgi:hypothetical protein